MKYDKIIQTRIFRHETGGYIEGAQIRNVIRFLVDSRTAAQVFKSTRVLQEMINEIQRSN